MKKLLLLLLFITPLLFADEEREPFSFRNQLRTPILQFESQLFFPLPLLTFPQQETLTFDLRQLPPPRNVFNLNDWREPNPLFFRFDPFWLMRFELQPPFTFRMHLLFLTFPCNEEEN